MDTPNANRIHIGIFGNINAGKSTLMNLLTGQDISLVSDIPGTTTDPVKKAMEIQGVGSVLLIDTAGFQDESDLGTFRMEKSRRILSQIDLALIVLRDAPIDPHFISLLQQKKKPAFVVLNTDNAELKKDIETGCPFETVAFDREKILSMIREYREKISDEVDFLQGIVEENMTVLLVMPQDIQAPKGRLILPQVQTLRALLEKNCTSICVTEHGVERALNQVLPDVIITDSQIFSKIYALKPPTTKITSFSVLMARMKGDIHILAEGAKKIGTLEKDARILIWESCTHAPKSEDIGTIKIPRLFREKLGNELRFSFARGNDLQAETGNYDLVVLCGACMVNRVEVLHRIHSFFHRQISVTNYGLAIAALTGILDQISYE